VADPEREEQVRGGLALVDETEVRPALENHIEKDLEAPAQTADGRGLSHLAGSTKDERTAVRSFGPLDELPVDGPLHVQGGGRSSRRRTGRPSVGRETPLLRWRSAEFREGVPRLEGMMSPEGEMTDEHYGEWNEKGASLSDKNAAKEYGLTREEIYRAVSAGELQYREQAIHGNPFLRLLRREVEAYVAKKHGKGELAERKRKAELKKVESEIRRLKRELRELEERKAELSPPPG
jgi:hypothetical protein